MMRYWFPEEGETAEQARVYKGDEYSTSEEVAENVVESVWLSSPSPRKYTVMEMVVVVEHDGTERKMRVTGSPVMCFFGEVM